MAASNFQSVLNFDPILERAQAARLKALEKENVRLRKVVSNLTLDALILKEVIEGKY